MTIVQTDIVAKTALDSHERRISDTKLYDYIQAMKVMIRTTPALDNGELAWARNLRTKLIVGKQAESGRESVTKEPSYFPT
jgi:hypothetical protein